MLVRSVRNTSERPPGTLPPASAPCSLIVTGNRKLATTANTAAQSVDTRYSVMTVLNRDPRPPFALAMDEATRSATSTGAMAFNALTNTCPRIPIPVHCGHNNPSTAPITRPIKIRSTSELSDHFFKREEILLIRCKVRKKVRNDKKSLYL